MCCTVLRARFTWDSKNYMQDFKFSAWSVLIEQHKDVNRIILVFFHRLHFSFSLRVALFLIAQVICEHVVAADFSASLHDRPEEELELNLEPIAGTNDFRVNITIDLSGKPWYDDRKEHYRCVRPAKCEKLQNSTCFGSKIQFKYTSVQLSNEESQENILRKLYQLEAFRNVPECWAVIQVCKMDTYNSVQFISAVLWIIIIISVAISVCRLYAKMYEKQKSRLRLSAIVRNVPSSIGKMPYFVRYGLFSTKSQMQRKSVSMQKLHERRTRYEIQCDWPMHVTFSVNGVVHQQLSRYGFIRSSI